MAMSPGKQILLLQLCCCWPQLCVHACLTSTPPLCWSAGLQVPPVLQHGQLVRCAPSAGAWPETCSCSLRPSAACSADGSCGSCVQPQPAVVVPSHWQSSCLLCWTEHAWSGPFCSPRSKQHTFRYC